LSAKQSLAFGRGGAMSDQAGQTIVLPQGGGAIHGIGEKFSPDLFTGTGNFTVPIALPPGRNGFQPQLSLGYSTGNGNGPFGLGWALTIPGVARKTSKGIPRYDDMMDTFILSGSEDLVRIGSSGPGTTQYQPRTEGLFARIRHHLDATNNYWEVNGKDGLTSTYGTPGAAGADSAVIADPRVAQQGKAFAWKLSGTTDPFGNRIDYSYVRDQGQNGAHFWDQLYLSEIRYVDYGDLHNPSFLVSVKFTYGPRPDPFSEHRSGFEIRTVQCCTQIDVVAGSDGNTQVRTYHLDYIDPASGSAPLNAASSLYQIRVEGHRGGVSEWLPPLEFGYSQFKPDQQKFVAVTGSVPSVSLADPSHELVDLFGCGLPDILEMNGAVRYWRNQGGGAFALPHSMADAPAGIQLADKGVQILDADGDGRADLLVTTGNLTGFYPLQFGGLWNSRSFQRRVTPSFDLKDPEVRIVDLDGDGVTDVIRSSTRLECYFNDGNKGWTESRWVQRDQLTDFPDVDFSDPRVKWADMTGDGLQDIVYVHGRAVDYWPSLGHGNWGKRITMSGGANLELPDRYDPKRLLLGDIDGDGAADLIYVDDGRITLWINRHGNGWGPAITIPGTPAVSDLDSIRFVDLFGSGVSGLLFSTNATGVSPNYRFLDFTGGTKPYLLVQMNNHMGAVTGIQYKSSTQFFTEDQKSPATRWKTPLPFPVQVVARVEVLDQFSQGKLTTEYRYHHGYWDGVEREFRGFGMVEQFDSETIDVPVAANKGASQFSPPTLLKTWFHQGAVGDEREGWRETDFTDEFWSGDPQILSGVSAANATLEALALPVKRDGLRSLRGRVLRTELYARDGSTLAERPYTVTEHTHGLRLEFSAADFPPVFFPYEIASRTTQWERGSDPMTQFSFSDNFDAFGQVRRKTEVACPRGWRSLADAPGGFLATRELTVYASPVAPDPYIHDRVATKASFKIDGQPGQKVLDLSQLDDASALLSLFAQTLHFYDSDPSDPTTGPFLGLANGKIGSYGALVRTEELVLTPDVLKDAYRSGSAVESPAEMPPYLSQASPNWPDEYPAGFRGLAAYAGYDYQTGGPGLPYVNGYYIYTERRQYDFHTSASGRGLVTVKRDALGKDTSITYDAYGFLPVSASQATGANDTSGLTTTAVYDYQVMQPTLATDANGNRKSYTFSPLGMLASISVQGKASETAGDSGNASTQFAYDLSAFDQRGVPLTLRTIRRVHHDTESDVPLPDRDQTIETVELSDGFGRLLQTRKQAEDMTFGDAYLGDSGLSTDPAAPAADAVGRTNSGDPPNVIVSGWQVYDNKGRVVEEFEPFFSKGWDFTASDAQHGNSALTFYDPRGRVTRTVNPDASEQRVVQGVPGTIAKPDLSNPDIFERTPWETYTYDANDNAGRTHPAASANYQSHWNTPASAEVDALGRVVRAVERNGSNPPTDWFATVSTYDIRGNLLSVQDPLGRLAFQHRYDLKNRRLRMENIDSGVRRLVLDARGSEIERRDSKGSLALRAYDSLNRVVRVWARDNATLKPAMRERLTYGDSVEAGLAQEQGQQLNALGSLYQHYDEAGLLVIGGYDFKGNIIASTRTVISDSVLDQLFNGPPANWNVPPLQVDWTTTGGVALDASNAYVRSSSYDALNRIKSTQLPSSVDKIPHAITPAYNHAGSLESVALDRTAYVSQIAYNAKGQRILIAYGNGLMTRYAYDPLTFKLTRMRTESFTTPSALAYHPAGPVLQDLFYEYDLSGNMLKLTDRTPGCGVVNNPESGQVSDPALAKLLVSGDALIRHFSYDPLYRLLSATGRECGDITKPRPWTDDRRCGADSGMQGSPNQDNAPNLTALFEEDYSYDPAGNMVALKHTAQGASWVRSSGIGGLNPQQWTQAWQAHFNSATPWQNAPGNQLTHVGDNDPAAAQTHFFDPNGNLVSETTSRHFEWDYTDRMRVYRTQTGSSEPSVYALYLYDSSGKRVKKFVRKQGGSVQATVYVDGLFEHTTWTEGAVQKQNNHVHVMDLQKRVAIIRLGDISSDDKGPGVEYHLGDHLDSSSVVVDGAGSWVNREEYLPYGETSFGCFAKKRYRFTGKERDEESGLYYHGARYYAPWLTRWVSCDPLISEPSAASNWFGYAKNSPLRYIDPKGLADAEPQPAGVPSAGPSFVVDRKQLEEARLHAAIKQAAKGNDPITGQRYRAPEPETPWYDKAAFWISDHIARPVLMSVLTAPLALEGGAVLGIGSTEVAGSASLGSTAFETSALERASLESATVSPAEMVFPRAALKQELNVTGEAVAPTYELPNRMGQGATHGILETPNVEGQVFLKSGARGASSYLPKDALPEAFRTSTGGVTMRGAALGRWSDVEIQAAASLRMTGGSEGTLTINNTMCSSCVNNLPNMLQEGQKLTVIENTGNMRHFVGQGKWK
jgi:RHS repeat-associated protein